MTISATPAAKSVIPFPTPGIRRTAITRAADLVALASAHSRADRAAVDARFRCNVLTRRAEWSLAYKVALAVIAEARPDGDMADVAAITGEAGHATLRGISIAPRTAILDACVAALAAEKLPREMAAILQGPLATDGE